MRGTTILVNSRPDERGFKEGRISGALLPGTLVQVKTSAGMGDDGRFTYEPASPAADGNRQEMMILLPDDTRGKPPTAAYADGDRCFVYQLQEGDEVNVLTDGPITFGDLLLLKSGGTGKVATTAATPQSNPFKALETIAAVNNSLVFAKFTGY